jgi:hypothetical protein
MANWASIYGKIRQKMIKKGQTGKFARSFEVHQTTISKKLKNLNISYYKRERKHLSVIIIGTKQIFIRQAGCIFE